MSCDMPGIPGVWAKTGPGGMASAATTATVVRERSISKVLLLAAGSVMAFQPGTEAFVRASGSGRRIAAAALITIPIATTLKASGTLAGFVTMSNTTLSAMPVL